MVVGNTYDLVDSIVECSNSGHRIIHAFTDYINRCIHDMRWTSVLCGVGGLLKLFGEPDLLMVKQRMKFGKSYGED